VDVVVVGVETPLLVGIYKDLKLIKTITNTKKTSQILPSIFQDIMKNYELNSLIYANGPGSFMAIKVVYIFLKTISIVKNIDLFGIDAFYFNNNSPIKSIGKNFFFKENDKIIIKPSKEQETKYFLPQELNIKDFTKDAKPLYILPAV
jgi:tRNA A37 threonylcarbamoyladenosine modification protein TsaB